MTIGVMTLIMFVFFGVRRHLQGTDTRPAELVDHKRASNEATLNADATLRTGSETTQRAPLGYRRRTGRSAALGRPNASAVLGSFRGRQPNCS